jgi:hypothetical protein
MQHPKMLNCISEHIDSSPVSSARVRPFFFSIVFVLHSLCHLGLHLILYFQLIYLLSFYHEG